MNALWNSILRKTQEDQRKTKDPYPNSVNKHQCHQGIVPFLSVSVFPNKFLRLVVISCCLFRDTKRNPLMQFRDLPVGNFLRAHV